MTVRRARLPRWAAPLVASASVSACSLLVDTGDLTGASLAAGDEAGAETSLADAAVEAVADAETPADRYRAAVLADRPVAYWPFDEAPDATAARDIVGGKSGRVSNGAVTFGVAGIAGTALALDRKGDLDVGDVLDLQGSAPYAFEAWLKARVGNDVFYEFLNKRTSSSDGYVAYVFHEANGTSVQWELGTRTGNRGTTMPIGLDTWQHVVVSYDPDVGMHVYVNGNRDSSSYADPTASATDNPAPLRIGSSFLGTIDELAIYDHALSLERIRAHAALGKP